MYIMYMYMCIMCGSLLTQMQIWFGLIFKFRGKNYWKIKEKILELLIWLQQRILLRLVFSFSSFVEGRTKLQSWCLRGNGSWWRRSFHPFMLLCLYTVGKRQKGGVAHVQMLGWLDNSWSRWIWMKGRDWASAYRNLKPIQALQELHRRILALCQQQGKLSDVK